MFVLTIFSCVSGCATVPYNYGTKYRSDREYALPEGEPQIERGEPIAVLDAADWYWPLSLLGKLILWNWKVDRHEISPETEAALIAYLDRNDLKNVKVRLNQYSPGAEWGRLFKNKSVGAGWRYTIGVISVAYYTILPGRFFGGDHYNPYSNTINIYSDIESVTLHEGGHAKDFAGRKYKGTYGFAYILPFVALYPEAVASSDAISYLKANNDVKLQKQAYNVLYPAYGTYVGGNLGQFWAEPWNTIISLGFVIPGHIIGRYKSAHVKDESVSPPAAGSVEQPPDPAEKN